MIRSRTGRFLREFWFAVRWLHYPTRSAVHFPRERADKDYVPAVGNCTRRSNQNPVLLVCLLYPVLRVPIFPPGLFYNRPTSTFQPRFGWSPESGIDLPIVRLPPPCGSPIHHRVRTIHDFHG